MGCSLPPRKEGGPLLGPQLSAIALETGTETLSLASVPQHGWECLQGQAEESSPQVPREEAVCPRQRMDSESYL